MVFDPIISVLETWQALCVLSGSGHCNEPIPTDIVLLDGFRTLDVVFKMCLCAV